MHQTKNAPDDSNRHVKSDVTLLICISVRIQAETPRSKKHGKYRCETDRPAQAPFSRSRIDVMMASAQPPGEADNANQAEAGRHPYGKQGWSRVDVGDCQSCRVRGQDEVQQRYLSRKRDELRACQRGVFP